MRTHLIYALLCSLLFLACDPEPLLLEPSKATPDGVHTGAFVLSEGLINLNNSTLSWIDFGTGDTYSWNRQGKTSFDCFEKANGRYLGDTANDMILYGSRLYIAVNISSTIEIIDVTTCRSIKQIKMENGGVPSQPRCLIAQGGFIYVCCYDGTVERIDTLTFKRNATVHVGRNPDGICYAAGKLYVSNSGGLDYTNPDSTVSVIDVESFTEIKRIPVRSNPGKICTDGKSVFVVSRGIFDYNKMDYDCRLHRINTDSDIVTDTYDIPVLNMDIVGDKAWLYRYGSGKIQIMDTSTGDIIQPDFITDQTHIESPYSIKVDPVTRNVYICEAAANYVTPGTLYCFNPNGELKYKIPGIGINPNTVLLTTANVRPADADADFVIQKKTPITKVFSYCPAPGQFVNTLPVCTQSDDSISMAKKCLDQLTTGNMITLGGFGGYITVGFDSPVINYYGPDFIINGNAVTNGAEPGVVWVSADVNGNNIPDDVWYEIYGSEQKAQRSKSAYSICYRKPLNDNENIQWHGSYGQKGSITRNDYHDQPYYPMWYKSDSVSFTATLLPSNMSYSNGTWIMPAFEYGYADNKPNSDKNSAFDIDWAVNADGSPANLSSIDFIKIQNGVIGCNDITGEQSTEISSIYNINP